MDTDRDFNDGLPIFCTRVIDRVSRKNVFVNFKSSGNVKSPGDILNDDILISNDVKTIIPIRLSPIYYTKDGKGDYVIIVLINDVFAIRRVLISDLMRLYLIKYTLDEIEKKYNSSESVKLTGQFIGHKITFERESIKTLTKEQCKEKITSVVNNKITLLEEQGRENQKLGQSEESLFDLHFRPTSKLLTCSVHTDKLPDSISFNEDRILIKQGGNQLVDIHLPFFVDLREPMRYKFDDRVCLFRAVFKILENL